MFIVKDHRIDKVDLDKIKSFYIEKIYYNNIDNDDKSGFQYCIMGESVGDCGDLMIEAFSTNDEAYSALAKLAK